MPPSSLVAPQMTNLGRLVNFVNGITGVSPGGNGVVNMPTGQRDHRVVFTCQAVNYLGGTAQATTTVTGSGSGATITPTVVNGVITAGTVVSGGTGYAVGNIIAPVDNTGVGATYTVATITGSAIATVTVSSGGIASPIDPTVFFSSFKLQVNGVSLWDISADNLQRINMANGQTPALGELALFFTEPWRNLLQRNETTSWDLAGQSTFTINFTVSPLMVSPSLTAIQEFDYLRNLRPSKPGGPANTPFLQPVARHSYSNPVNSGRNDINWLPYSFPISRMWLLGSSPGNISQVEVFQDGNKPGEYLIGQIYQAYEEYGFQFGQPTWLNQNQPTTPALQRNYNPLKYFDAAFIADPDQRLRKALKCQASTILRIYSNVAQTLTVVIESLPGSYS